jgi:glycosyltransferase involved in cell wall biosynthesis
MIDIANAYAETYDKVVLFEGVVEEYERPLSEEVKCVKIMTYNRDSGPKRIFTWGIAFLQILFKLLFGYRSYEIVYFTNPPMSYFASLFIKNTFSVVVYDVYPDALYNVGIREGNFIYNSWAAINRKLYAKAKQIFTLSDGMATVLSKYVTKEKIKVIPNWPFTDKFAPIPKSENPFVKKHHLEDKFVVMYSGNMGYTHSVDVLLDAAAMTKMDESIHYLLIGQGKKRPILEERVKNDGLKNVTILDLQPFDVIPYSFAAADLAVITLNEESGAVSVPGKTYDFLSVGAPLLCVCPPVSEMIALTNNYENGRCFSSKDVSGIVEFIQEVATDPELQKKMSENSLIASKDFTKANAYKFIY